MCRLSSQTNTYTSPALGCRRPLKYTDLLIDVICNHTFHSRITLWSYFWFNTLVLGRWQVCLQCCCSVRRYRTEKVDEISRSTQVSYFFLLKLSCERKDRIKDGRREEKVEGSERRREEEGEMKERNSWEYRRKERNAYQWEDPRDWKGTNDDDDVSVQKDLSLHTHTALMSFKGLHQTLISSNWNSKIWGVCSKQAWAHDWCASLWCVSNSAVTQVNIKTWRT